MRTPVRSLQAKTGGNKLTYSQVQKRMRRTSGPCVAKAALITRGTGEERAVGSVGSQLKISRAAVWIALSTRTLQKNPLKIPRKPGGRAPPLQQVCASWAGLSKDIVRRFPRHHGVHSFLPGEVDAYIQPRLSLCSHEGHWLLMRSSWWVMPTNCKLIGDDAQWNY